MRCDVKCEKQKAHFYSSDIPVTEFNRHDGDGEKGDSTQDGVVRASAEQLANKQKTRRKPASI